MHKGNVGTKSSGRFGEPELVMLKPVNASFVLASLNGQVENLSV